MQVQHPGLFNEERFKRIPTLRASLELWRRWKAVLENTMIKSLRAVSKERKKIK